MAKERWNRTSRVLCARWEMSVVGVREHAAQASLQRAVQVVGANYLWV